jgi:hypothetical protein
MLDRYGHLMRDSDAEALARIEAGPLLSEQDGRA